MSDESEYQREFRRNLPGAQNFYEALTAALEKYHGSRTPEGREAASQECEIIGTARLNELPLDDIMTGYYLPQEAALLGVALRHVEQNPEADFDETLHAMTGLYTWSFCNRSVGEIAAIMQADEKNLTKRLQAVNYTVTDGVIAHHPGLDANTRYDNAYFLRLRAAGRKSGPGSINP